MSLASITADVSRISAQLENQLREIDVTPTTADEGAWFSSSAEPQSVRVTRNALADAATQLLRLTQGPEDYLLGIAMGSTCDAAVMGTIVRFNLASLVPRSGSITSPALAKNAGLEESVLIRLMRYAVGLGIFREPDAGSFAHSPSSAKLAGDEHLQNIFKLTTQDVARILVHLPDALNEKKATTAFNLAFPEHKTVLDYCGKDTQASKRYHQYLLGRVHTSRWAVNHLQSAWHWADVGSKTIVDVGGSSGHTCLALADVCPQAQFIIQDIDPVALASARTALQAASTVTAARTSFEEYDFFTPQKTAADIYIFRHILHNWSDDDAVRILRNLIPALKPGACVLVSEGLLPEPPARQTNHLDAKQIRIEDIVMLAVFAAPERSESEYVRIFTEASSAFRFVGTTSGKNGAFQSLLEFKFIG